VFERSALDRLLHRLALESPSIIELMYDLESVLFQGTVPRRDVVYVTGLARCGSTSLLRALHSSNAFACLTYRDMPFVIAPNIWRHIRGFQVEKPAGRERLHGDGIFEDLDSPEGLEEVFWRKELGNIYIQENGLFVHHVPEPTLSRLKIYQSLICAKYASMRYLAKNNNMLLRIESLAPRTPDCCYLVLFREPLAHAESLLRQHLRFLAIKGFNLDYMRWLVHHEFGADHRPFRFSHASATGLSPEGLDYWLERWIEAYAFLLDVLRLNLVNTVPVQYEHFCDDKAYRKKIFERVGIPLPAGTFENRNRSVSGGSKSLVERATGIYSELCSRADRLL
jgi:hypothetical protein